MPETKDLLEQFKDLPEVRQEELAARILEALGVSPHPFTFRDPYRPEFPSVISTPNVCGGSPRIIRTRIPVWLLQHLRQLGFSEAKSLTSYPTLTASDLNQAWKYVAAHRSEIDKEIAENEQY